MKRIPRVRRLGLGVMVLALACAERAPAPPVSKTTSSGDREIVLPSGTTARVASSWTVTRRKDGATLQAPGTDVTLEIVEQKTPNLALAWAARHEGFSRKVDTTEKVPAQNGWKTIEQTSYRTSPEENRWVFARVHVGDRGAVVLVADWPADQAQQRLSEVLLAWESITAPGYQPVSFAGKDPLPVNEERLAEVREYIEASRKAADIPGLAVALFDGKKIYLAEGFGVRERGKAEPVTDETLFMMASNTKTMTTMLLAKLVEQGKIAWDTPVVDVYPQFRLGDSETTKKVQIQHLVCACTGLPRQDAELVFTWKDQTPESQFDVLATMKPTTEFGKLFQYSNPLASAAGYIAGHVVHPDLTLGAAYDQAMQEMIFAPLGMADTTLDFDRALKSNHASPHGFDAQGRNVPFDADRNRLAAPYRPAGGGWISARDFARYVQLELNDGRLPDGTVHVAEDSVRARRKPWVRAWSEKQRYGMGIVTDEIYGLRVLEHGGSLNGFQSQFFALPEVGLGGVILTNANSGGNFAFENFTKGMIEILFGGERTALAELRIRAPATRDRHRKHMAELTVPAKAAWSRQLARHYHSEQLGDIVVREQGTDLVFEFAGWHSRMATRENPDGSVSFISVDPGFDDFEFVAAKPAGHVEVLSFQDPQHKYQFKETAEPKRQSKGSR